MPEQTSPADDLGLSAAPPPQSDFAQPSPLLYDYAPPPRRTNPLRVWPVFVAWVSVFPIMILVWFIAFAIWFAVGAIHGTPIRDAQAHTKDILREPLFLIPVLLAISLGNAGIALCGGFLSPLKVVRRLALNPGTASWGALILLSIGTLAAGMVGINIVQLIGIHANQGSNQIITDMARNSSRAAYATLLLVVSVCPAVCEELLFRGYAQTRLVARWGSIAGIAVATLMFAISHLDPVQTPDMLFLGSYLGWTAWRTGSTRTSMLCHLVNNALAVGLSMIPAKLGDPTEPNTHAHMLIATGIGLTVCAICTWSANRTLPPRAAMGTMAEDSKIVGV
jgi:membrane protease YdiL (CAAX protease family)